MQAEIFWRFVSDAVTEFENCVLTDVVAVVEKQDYDPVECGGEYHAPAPTGNNEDFRLRFA